MGNEGSLPSDSDSQVSDWQSIYSYGSRAGRRSSLGSMRIPSPMDPPEPDLSHLSPEEVAKIREVISRAKELKDEESKRIRKLEEEYVEYTADVERRASRAVAKAGEMRKDSPLCPICMDRELKIQEGKMTDGQNVCVDCGNLTCLKCGAMEPSVTSKDLEWVCHVCHKRRQLVLSSGLWHPGCDVDEDVPLSRELERHFLELQSSSAARGPLTRSLSTGETVRYGAVSTLQRQMSLPDYQMPTTYSTGHSLEAIQESGYSENVSDTVSPEPLAPTPVKVGSPTDSEDLKKSITSINSGSIRGMGQPSSRSDSDYSDGVSDVDMEDATMVRSAIDGVSPDDGSDDYSFMSICSSDDNTSVTNVHRKHRPKSLNLSRSVSGASSEDETSDSALSTDVESRYSNIHVSDSHDLRIAMAASAFVEEMRGVDINSETDDEVTEISAIEDINATAKVRFSPSAPVSPSWREGLDSPPFSPRRRDSYPGKRRGSSPVSPKDKRFTYSDISPPSRQLSLEELYDKESHSTNMDQSLVPFAQRPSPKSPDELIKTFYSTSGEIMTFERPTSALKKSKPFYSLEDAAMGLNDTTSVMDLATYAATVATNTANLTSMSVSPTNIETVLPGVDMEPSNISSPGFYDSIPYSDETIQDDENEDIEIADPSEKSIDYQGNKRQKARPPTTDWSPVIDLSPILDVSPSLEEAEQAEMLAQQKAERERQASREDLQYSPIKAFVAINDENDYQYYGLKRYGVVEDISELVKQNNDNSSPDRLIMGSSDSSDETIPKTTLGNGSSGLKRIECGKSIESEISNGKVVAYTSIGSTQNKDHRSQVKLTDIMATCSIENLANVPELESSPIVKPLKSDNPIENDTQNQLMIFSKPHVRRKLPEPTPEIIATQKTPVSQSKRMDRNTDNGLQNIQPQKPVRPLKQEPKEPTRDPPILKQSNFSNTFNSTKQKARVHNKESSEKHRRSANEMKTKSDSTRMSHLEDNSAFPPQYRVLESPPSPENKLIIRREYSDSTSVSPCSSPDRDSFLYPSPVTPADSDSSPPKPHSPSSGTDFEDEFILICDNASDNKIRETARNANMSNDRREARRYHYELSQENNTISEIVATIEKSTELEKCTTLEKDGVHSKIKLHTIPSKDHKQKEMKKVRRKLPQVPPDEETNTSPKHKQRPIPAKKPILRTDNRVLSMSGTSTSASDDSSMNEDDKEVASITRKKHINDLDKPTVDKPSIDKCNGNYIKSNEIFELDNYRPDDMIQVNIPPEVCYSNNKHADDSGKDNYLFDTDALIDAMINIYGAPITQAMKGLKKRLQEELRRVTEGRRKKIDEIEELRVLKFQLGELKIGTSNKATASGSASNGKKRSSSNSRTSPQMINRRARHKRQSSDPMVAKFSPIKEDKDIESEIQIITFDDNRSCRTGDDSSQSGVSDTDSTRSEPTSGYPHICRKVKPTDYAKMFYSVHAQSSETLDKRICVHVSPELISCHSEGNLPNNVVDEEARQREEKRRELQFEIEKRKRQLAEREYKLKEAWSCIGVANKQLTQSCDEISAPKNMPPYVHPRPIPTGIIKPIDDDSNTLPKKANYQHEANYSSTEYLAHKQEEFMKKKYENLTSFSSPFLYSADFGEKSAFVPQQKTNLDSYSYSTGNVNVGKDKVICSSATLPNIPISKADLDNNNRHIMSDTDSSPPSELTPAMPLLTDVKAKSRKIIHEIGSGSRPVSAEFNVGVEDLMNGIYRVESDNSVDADEPIMKHLMEGGVTILKQLERKKQPPPSLPKKYEFPVKRILLTTDPKEKYIKGRQGNGVGMKIIGGKTISGIHEVGAYVAVIYKGGVADRLRGEVKEGDQILEWNGIDLTGKSYEEVQQIISQAANGEVELVIRSSQLSIKALGDATAQAPDCHSSYDNLECDEDSDSKQAPPITQKCIDPQHLEATLEEIEEDESPCMSQSSSQQDYNTASASSGCSSPLSEPSSTSSDQQKMNRKTMKSSTGSASLGNSDVCQKKTLPKSFNTAKIRYGSQGHLQATPHDQASKIPPSSSDFFRRPQTYEMVQQRSRQPSVILDVSSLLHTDNTKKVKNAVEIVISEKSEIKKSERLQQQQSNSFDDFLRMSHHAGVDDRQLSPSKTSRKPSKKGLSASAMDLGKQKCSESEEDIKKSPKGVCRGKRQMGDIQLKLKHDAHKNEFRVRVIQARNLLPMDLNGLSDPFVKLYLLPGRCSDNKRRTKHVPKTLNPEWNETIIFPNVHIEELRNKTLEVTVWDYDRFKANDFLGEVVIDFSEDSFLDNLPHWYPLCDHDDPKGLDIPQPTVLPPRHNRANSVSPITMERPEKSNQSGSIKSERPRPGMGRRRRSFDALKDVDKV